MDDQPKTTRWTETHRIKTADPPLEYLRKMFRLVATKNRDTFRDFPPGQVILERVAIGKKPDSFAFQFRQNDPGFSDNFRSSDFSQLGIGE